MQNWKVSGTLLKLHNWYIHVKVWLCSELQYFLESLCVIKNNKYIFILKKVLQGNWNLEKYICNTSIVLTVINIFCQQTVFRHHWQGITVFVAWLKIQPKKHSWEIASFVWSAIQSHQRVLSPHREIGLQFWSGKSTFIV